MKRVKLHRIFLCVALTAAIFLNGCFKMAVTHSALAPVPATNTRTGKVALYRRADGKLGHVGKFTMPYAAWIPVGAVMANGDSRNKIMDYTADALKQVGYETVTVSRNTPCDLPILTCDVKRFKFKTYTMFFPFGFRSGRITLEAKLVNAYGKVFWTQEFDQSDLTGGLGGFEQMSDRAMTKLLNDMAAAFSDAEFHDALVAATRNAPGAAAAKSADNGDTVVQ